MSHGARLFSYEDREEIARLTAALATRDAEIAALRETVRMLHAADRDAAAAIAAGVARAESAELGCEIAYRREPTQAEGDAHEYRHEQSMGPAHGSGECFVSMGGWTGHRCRICSRWVWGGQTACVACVAENAAEVSPKLCFGCRLEADMKGASQ